LKCKYGDNLHIAENEEYYSGSNSDSLKKQVYQLWKRINDLSYKELYGIKSKGVELELGDYYLVNREKSHETMST
jgi:hypothetical protein